MKRDELFDFADRLEIAGFFTEIELKGWRLPELTVESSPRRKMKKRIGWVPSRCCVTIIPKNNRRLRK